MPFSIATPLPNPESCMQSHWSCTSQPPVADILLQLLTSERTGVVSPQMMSLPSWSKLRSTIQVWPSSQEIVVRPMSPCATMTETSSGSGALGSTGDDGAVEVAGGGGAVDVAGPRAR